MIQTLTIQGCLPNLNDIIDASKHTRWTYDTLKKNTEYIILAACFSGKTRLQPMPYAYISCDWVEPNMKRDPDNICAGLKFVLDTLVYKKILPGDGWAHVLGIAHTFRIDKDAPHVAITLRTKP
jgi:hypothetical protein